MKNKVLKISVICVIILIVIIVSVLIITNRHKQFAEFIDNPNEEFHDDSEEFSDDNCVLSGTEMLEEYEAEYVLKMCNKITVDNTLYHGTQVSYFLDIIRDNYYDVIIFENNRRFRIYKDETYEELK